MGRLWSKWITVSFVRWAANSSISRCTTGNQCKTKGLHTGNITVWQWACQFLQNIVQTNAKTYYSEIIVREGNIGRFFFSKTWWCFEDNCLSFHHFVVFAMILLASLHHTSAYIYAWIAPMAFSMTPLPIEFCSINFMMNLLLKCIVKH